MNFQRLDLKSQRTTHSLAVAGIVAVTACAWGLSCSREAGADYTAQPLTTSSAAKLIRASAHVPVPEEPKCPA